MLSVTSLPYEQEQKVLFKLFNESIEVISKPGLPEWNQWLPSTQLIAENTILKPDDHVLLMGCHHGGLGVYLSRYLPQGLLSIMDNNFIALEMTRKTFSANHSQKNYEMLHVIDLPEISSRMFDSVIIQLPKGRMLFRRWLLQSINALKDGGSLYLAGPNKSGVESAVKDAAELFGNFRVLAYKKGNRIAQFINMSDQQNQPDWATIPGISPGSWIEFDISLPNRTFHIRSLPGVFSYDHLDRGTEMLLESINIRSGANVLDVGCGYGIIGLFASVHGAAWVDFVDNDLLATASCKETIALNRITNVTVFTGDLLTPVSGRQYDLILSNPPFHAGQAVDYQIAEALIRQSYQALVPGGQLIIVANRFLAYDRLIKVVFSNVSRLAESKQYHILSGLKSIL